MLRLLADELVQLEEIEVDSVAHETVRRTLKKRTPTSPTATVGDPPEDDADFVSHLEDVRALRHESYDPDRPVVCFVEHPKELIAVVQEPPPAEPGSVATYAYHYDRQGRKNLCLASEPLDGWRTVSVTDRRTTEDWVRHIKHLVDEHYPKVDCTRLVLDNLSTQNPAAFEKYFEPAEARRLLSKLEFHITQVHGSWLNMA